MLTVGLTFGPKLPLRLGRITLLDEAKRHYCQLLRLDSWSAILHPISEGSPCQIRKEKSQPSR